MSSLPFGAAVEPSPGTPAPVPVRRRVLIVDDLAENREILSELLEPEGHQIATARDGEEAMRAAFAWPPDLVLIDVDMPRLDGIEACRRLKADERTHFVPVVLVTGHGARADRLRGIAAGCDDFLAKPVDAGELLARTRSLLRAKSLLDELEHAERILLSMAVVLEAQDPYTRGHSERVANYAEALGEVAGLDLQERRDLRRAGLLHDIGKVGVPVDLIRKPGKLTPEEYELVKRHPSIGYEICKPLRTMAALLPLIRGHHERLDGRGYPDGLSAEAIPLSLRCLSLADVYDALASDRSYRPAMSRPAALELMRREAAAGLWDAGLLEMLAETLEHRF